MSMADDSTLRSYRSNDPYRRAADASRPGDQASDPLAELARLIGQADPFAELGRGQPRQGSEQGSQQRPQPGRQAPRAAPAAASDEWHRASAREPQHGFDDYASREAQSSYRDSHRETYREPYQGSRQSSPHDVDHGSSYDPRYGSSQDYADPQARGADGRRHDAYQDSHSYQADGHAYQDSHPYRDNRSYDDVHVGDRQGQQYADDRDGVRHDGRMDDDYYQDDVPLEPDEDEMYDDAPRPRRRGLATALALISCAMLGTAGAYAYRNYTGNAGSIQPPPVITADSSTPTKIVPASAGDAPSSKLIQDRLATAGNEQIISKQEEPVALREPGTPTPVAPAQGGTQQPSGGVSNEPRKVRTVVIRPDGNDQSSRPVGALAPAPTRSAATPPAPKAAAAPPARSGGSPISLDREASEPATVPADRTRTAAVPPPARATPEPAKTSGGFVVQLSSQKSEGDAQASFRTLQGKFPNELGGRQPIIRRADLGSKGIVYRAMVGPFESSKEASQFCTSFKAAGGQCFLPKE